MYDMAVDIQKQCISGLVRTSFRSMLCNRLSVKCDNQGPSVTTIDSFLYVVAQILA